MASLNKIKRPTRRMVSCNKWVWLYFQTTFDAKAMRSRLYTGGRSNGSKVNHSLNEICGAPELCKSGEWAICAHVDSNLFPNAQIIVSAECVLDGRNGGCLACGEVQYGGVEPDAQKYECEECGANKVYGLDELAIIGHLLIDD